MKQYYTTPFGALIKQRFGTIEEFANFMHVSHPTARHYANRPHNMSIKHFVWLSEKLNINPTELFNIIRDEGNTNI
jgi:hypothetical protein